MSFEHSYLIEDIYLFVVTVVLIWAMSSLRREIRKVDERAAAAEDGLKERLKAAYEGSDKRLHDLAETWADQYRTQSERMSALEQRVSDGYDGLDSQIKNASAQLAVKIDKDWALLYKVMEEVRAKLQAQLDEHEVRLAQVCLVRQVDPVLKPSQNVADHVAHVPIVVHVEGRPDGTVVETLQCRFCYQPLGTREAERVG